MSAVSSDDLTTDAMPSAPRADPENDVYIPSPKIDEGPRPSQSETKQIPHSAFGNIINITNSNLVHIGSNIVINPKPRAAERDNTKQASPTEEIRAVFRNNGRVCRDDLILVAQHIDDKWKDVGKALEHSDGELNAFEHDYKQDGLREVIFKMLYSWMCRKTKDAKVGTLAKVLWDCKQYEAVKLWSADILKR